eukprot:20629-Chlamydomonas_euryale.AAC.1
MSVGMWMYVCNGNLRSTCARGGLQEAPTGRMTWSCARRGGNVVQPFFSVQPVARDDNDLAAADMEVIASGKARVKSKEGLPLPVSRHERVPRHRHHRRLNALAHTAALCAQHRDELLVGSVTVADGPRQQAHAHAGRRERGCRMQWAAHAGDRADRPSGVRKAQRALAQVERDGDLAAAIGPKRKERLRFTLVLGGGAAHGLGDARPLREIGRMEVAAVDVDVAKVVDADAAAVLQQAWRREGEGGEKEGK